MAERTCLLNMRMGNCTKGSNPLLSAFFALRGVVPIFRNELCSVIASRLEIGKTALGSYYIEIKTNIFKTNIRGVA